MEQISHLPVMLRPREAAEILRISLPTMRAMLRDGILPSVRVGRRGLRIATADLEVFIKNHRRAPWGE